MNHQFSSQRRASRIEQPERCTVEFNRGDRPPVCDVLTWDQEYAIRAAHLFKKWTELLTTPKRFVPEHAVDGYVPKPAVFNSTGVHVRGVQTDVHRAGVAPR